jgi:hypothetical protein
MGGGYGPLSFFHSARLNNSIVIGARAHHTLQPLRGKSWHIWLQVFDPYHLRSCFGLSTWGHSIGGRGGNGPPSLC